MIRSAQPAPAADSGGRCIVALDMGYGHLRAAASLAAAADQPFYSVDREPLATAHERQLWTRMRGAYERFCRLTDLPLIGSAARAGLDAITRVPPLDGSSDLRKPNRAVRTVRRQAAPTANRARARMRESCTVLRR